MLKRGKKKKGDRLPAEAKKAGRKSLESLSKPLRGDSRTIVGERIFIEGSISGRETLEIAGSVTGSIELEGGNLTIGPKGRVKGDVRARNVSIAGNIEGNVNALERVKVIRDADFHGEIKAKFISVEDGANFKGVIELEREPQKKSSHPKISEKSEAPGDESEKPAQ